MPDTFGDLDDSPVGWISLGPRSRTLYERAGFREVVRRSPTRVVMRRRLRPRTSG
jgi:hypothetical protein